VSLPFDEMENATPPMYRIRGFSSCPQVARTGWLIDENAFPFQWDDGQPGED